MSAIELILTKAKFIAQQCPQPSDSSLERAIDGSLTGIVTYIKVANGEYQMLSQYEHDIWVFPASQGKKADKACDLNLNFATISDTQMKRMAKWVVWNKMKEDLAVGTLRNTLCHLNGYFKWVLNSDTTAEHGLTAFTSNAYVKFVNTLTSTRKGEIKPLVAITKVHRFLVLEDLYRYCKTFDFVKEHPWSESSAYEQAGHVGEAYQEARKKAKTLIIPDEVLIPLCQFTKSYLDRADEIIASAKNKESLLLRDSCIFWLLLTTGMRIHEILGIKRGAYRSETKDDTTYYYIETISEKTHTGLAEWIAPKIATEAIDILGQLSTPLQAQLEQDVLNAKEANDHAEVHRLKQISDHICLAKSQKKKNALNILSGRAISEFRLPNLCKQVASDWNLAAHQFRRTFANYVVHSELGDLRALKDHFKHWSITMTALYAFNDNLDAELFEELLREKYLVEEEIKQDWFELDSPIAGGGMAQKIKKVRQDGELIKVFGSLQNMAKAYSSSIPIHSTGIAWCTNDDECRCDKSEDCEHGIVDKRHLPYWEGMLVQQMKLMQLDDIGEIGREAARKGLERIERLLSAMGIDVAAMKQEINQREYIEVKNVQSKRKSDT
ncbi:site-specific integrase [Photobacterium leiognathi]|uniref:tyrosine-type recombinase/integrase n=1 Tax=Photobacterium leiognathi TaxID=553611 RepID=UPI00298147CA|nr:tyrosine-type recombinase/integrase [Photobacterium leiognathi]